MCFILLGMVVAAAAPAAMAQQSPELFREIPAANLNAAADAAGLDGPSVVRSRYVEVNLARILPAAGAAEPAPSRARGGSSRRLSFNLFPDTVLEFDEDRGEYLPDGSFVWHSRTVPGSGQALLVVRDGVVAGSVRSASGEFYRIRSINSQVHVIRQVTYQGTPAVEDAIPVPESEIPQMARAQQDTPVAEQSGATTLDVLVVYTAGARQAAGGASAIASEISLAIAELNQSFSNSGVQMQARLAHAAEISYSDEQNSLNTTLLRLRSSGDGYLDQAHTLRNQYGADVVALLVNGPGSSGGTVGVGYIMQTVGSYFADYAFSVTEVNFATGPSYAMLHEIGHNLGCAHDRDHSSSPGAYPYSYGYQRSQAPQFRTIMSYNCAGVNCPTINHWSNPNVNYSGYPTGVASSQSNSADNRQSLNNTKATAAAWRQGAQSAQYAPSAVSVTPASGSSSSRSFSYTFSDGNGYGDMTSLLMLINSSLNAQGACYLYYTPSANRLYLASDQGSSWLGPVVLGASGVVQNSQCAVNAASSSRSMSGNTLTLSVALDFQSAFSGSKTNYMFAHDASGRSSGWQARGTWSVPGGASNSPPTAAPVSPSSGSGSSQTLTYAFSDPNGYSSIVSALMLINDSLKATSACYTYYSPGANQLYLLNDSSSSWTGPVIIGASGTLSNSQCTINSASSSVTASGTTLTVRLATTFTSSFSGSKTTYMFAQDSGGLSTGWQARGTWTVPTGSSAPTGGGANEAPTAVGLTPSAGTGSSETFGLTFADPNGYADLPAAQVVVGPTLSAAASCFVFYSRAANSLLLMNDAGNAWTGPVTLGNAATIENSQCRVNAGASTVAGSGNNLTLNLRLDFKDALQGANRIYMFTMDSDGLASGWQQRGTWTVP